MAEVKISALPAGTTLTGVETFPAVQGGATKKFTAVQVKGYKVYTAIIQQLDPVVDPDTITATVFENSLGITMTWTRTSEGNIEGGQVGSGIFLSNKTWLMIDQNGLFSDDLYRISVHSDDDVQITLTNEGSGVDGISTYIEIRIYP